MILICNKIFTIAVFYYFIILFPQRFISTIVDTNKFQSEFSEGNFYLQRWLYKRLQTWRI